MRRAFLLAVALVWLVGCATIDQALYSTSTAVAPAHPVYGTPVLNVIPEKQEVAQAQQAWTQLEAAARREGIAVDPPGRRLARIRTIFAQLVAVAPRQDLPWEVHLLRHTARTLLDTYLGQGTGERVLEGLIRRGDGEVIPAVIWWADLRGSTALAEQLPRQRYLQLLNRFFESTAGVVIDHGGEVLKFIGDAVMAIFPLDDHENAAERALAAADEALAAIEKANAERADPSEPKLAIALALHQGEVNYGNVGVAGRLDFTVTGPAVNEVARLEGLSKTLDRPVVASSAFARLVPGRLASLGS